MGAVQLAGRRGAGSPTPPTASAFAASPLSGFWRFGPGTVPALSFDYLPEIGGSCREVGEPGFRPEGEIDFRTSRSNYRVFTTEHRASFHNSPK